MYVRVPRYNTYITPHPTMHSQRSAELRRSRRLSEQKQRTLNEKGPSSGHAQSVVEQTDSVLDMVQNAKDHRKKKMPAMRPPNAFMLFRSDFWAREKLKVIPIERDHRDISRIAAICWHDLDDETKAVYRKRADEHKELHRLHHPEYRYSPVLRETTRIQRRRTRKGGNADEERCKQLAVRVMTEFHKRDAKRRDTELIPNSLESKKEWTKSVLNTETSTEGVVVPVAAQENSPIQKEEDCRTSIQTLITDTSDSHFGQRLRLEKYIPELRFWYAVEESRQDAGRLVFDSRNDVEWVAESSRGIDKLSSPLAGEVDPDSTDELDQYFQFDKYDEN